VKVASCQDVYVQTILLSPGCLGALGAGGFGGGEALLPQRSRLSGVFHPSPAPPRNPFAKMSRQGENGGEEPDGAELASSVRPQIWKLESCSS